MLRKRNAPAHKGEGVVCLLAGDIDAHSTNQVRVQYLNRFGLPLTRAIIAPLCFGEGR